MGFEYAVEETPVLHWCLTFKISVNALYCVGISMSVVGGVQETRKFLIKFQFLFQNNRVAFLLQNHTLKIV
jgi:hypothetical protein